MTNILSTVLRLIREERAHRHRRLERMEAVAMDGRRIDWMKFPESRGYAEGAADALDKVEELVSEALYEDVIAREDEDS